MLESRKYWLFGGIVLIASVCTLMPGINNAYGPFYNVHKYRVRDERDGVGTHKADEYECWIRNEKKMYQLYLFVPVIVSVALHFVVLFVGIYCIRTVYVVHVYICIDIYINSICEIQERVCQLLFDLSIHNAQTARVRGCVFGAATV